MCTTHCCCTVCSVPCQKDKVYHYFIADRHGNATISLWFPNGIRNGAKNPLSVYVSSFVQSLAFCLASYFQSGIKGLEVVEVHKRPIFVSTSAGRCCWWQRRWSHRECSYQSLHRPAGAGRHRPRQDVHRDNHCLPDILGTTFSGHLILIRRLQDGDALHQV